MSYAAALRPVSDPVNLILPNFLHRSRATVKLPNMYIKEEKIPEIKSSKGSEDS